MPTEMCTDFASGVAKLTNLFSISFATSCRRFFRFSLATLRCPSKTRTLSFNICSKASNKFRYPKKSISNTIKKSTHFLQKVRIKQCSRPHHQLSFKCKSSYEINYFRMHYFLHFLAKNNVCSVVEVCACFSRMNGLFKVFECRLTIFCRSVVKILVTWVIQNKNKVIVH